MKFFTEYRGQVPDIVGKRKKVDNTIYTFDIETTSYYILDGKIYSAIEYKNLTKDQQEQCEFHSNMYIWQFGINDTIYYRKDMGKFKRIFRQT